ncbi:MAG: 50S ribosomal protein L21, partial [bacterium]|nr:50S ribosomal protein L21 [bacterium]
KISKENVVDFDSVLLVENGDLHIGQPFVKDARIKAKILEEFKAPKIIVFKKNSKKQYRRTRGHRQNLHRIQIEKIELKAKAKKAEAAPKAAKEPKVEEKKEKE